MKPLVAFLLRSNLSCGTSYFVTVAWSFHVPLSRVRGRVRQLITSLGRALPGLVLVILTGAGLDLSRIHDPTEGRWAVQRAARVTSTHRGTCVFSNKIHRHTFEGKVRPKEDCVTLTGHSDVPQLPTVCPLTAFSSLTRDSLKDENREVLPLLGNVTLESDTPSGPGLADNHETLLQACNSAREGS